MKATLRAILNAAGEEDINRLVAYYKEIRQNKLEGNSGAHSINSNFLGEYSSETSVSLDSIFEVLATGDTDKKLKTVRAGEPKRVIEHLNSKEIFNDKPGRKKTNLKRKQSTLDHRLSLLYKDLVRARFEVLSDFSFFLETEKKLGILLSMPGATEATAEFYRHLILQSIRNLQGSYQQAFLHSREVLNILKRGDNKQKDEWWMYYYCELAVSYCLSKRYHNAFKSITKSYNYVAAKSEEEVRVMEVLFLILSKLNDTGSLKDLVKRADHNQHIKQDEFLSSQWNYYNGVNFLLNEKYEESVRIFKNKSGFKRTCGSWCMQSLLLEVVCRLEKGSWQWFDYRFEAIRKCVERYSLQPLNIDGEYVYAIFRVMKKLRKHDYDFALLMKVDYSSYLQLSRMTPEYIKRPGTAPVFDFAKWFREGAKDRRVIK